MAFILATMLAACVFGVVASVVMIVVMPHTVVLFSQPG
jgi:hypothetical protein